MTLAELKKLLESVVSKLKKFGNEKNISRAVQELHEDLQNHYANDSGADEKVSNAMREVNLMVRNFMSAVKRLQLLQDMLQTIVQKAEENSIPDAEIINLQLPVNYIQDCNLIVSAYAAALMQINIAYNDIQSNQVVFLSANDLSKVPPPALNHIVETMGGHFDLTVCNNQLVSKQHTKLDKNFICEGFYKDHDQSYFQDQMVNPIGRRENFDPEAAKKCTDFVDLYLNKTGLPESARPNLTGLLSVLAYQSGIGGILYEQGISNVHVACLDGYFEEAFIVNGGIYDLQFFFKPDGTIKVACMSTFYPPPTTYMFDNGFILQEGINFVQGVTFDIACNYSPTTGLVFAVKNFQRNLSACLDKSHLDTLEWRVKQNTLSPHHQVDKKYFSFFENTAEYLIKYAGFNSKAELTEKVGVTSSVLAIFSSGLYDQILTVSTKSLSKEEAAFFRSLSLAFYRDHKSPQQIAKLVTNYFASRFYEASNEDKTRYVYLLKMAVDFAGFNCAPVKEAFEELLNGLANNPTVLLEALKKDIHFYHLYVKEISSFSNWFNNLPKFTDQEHFAILQALNTNNVYVDFLAKNPEWLQENPHAISFLCQLPVAQKIVFLSCAKETAMLLKFLKGPFFDLSDKDVDFMTNESVILGEILVTSQLELAPEILVKLHNIMEILDKTSQGAVKPLLAFLQIAERTYLAAMAERLQQEEVIATKPEKKTRAPMPLPEQKPPAESAQKTRNSIESPKKSISAPEVAKAELEGTSPKELFHSFQTVLTQAEKKAKPYIESKQAVEKEGSDTVAKDVEKTGETHVEKEVSAKSPGGKTQG